MSPDIMKEIEFLFTSAILGVAITFLYDWLRIIRRVISHSNIWISLEDFFFWIVCSVATFAMLYYENNGILRWFAVIGATVGMFLYKCFLSRYFVKVAVMLFNQILKVIKKVGTLFAAPLIWMGSKLGMFHTAGKKRGGRLFRAFKKKLTKGVKLVKMMLCKH